MKKLVIILLVLLLAVPLAYASTRIVLVANTIDHAYAPDFVEFLDTNARPVLHITSGQLDAHNLEPIIVILGGPDAPEGVGVQVSSLLSQEEQDVLREKGTRKMFVKTNVWKKGQVVIVLAGYNRNLTHTATIKYKDNVLSESTDARLEELSIDKKQVDISIEAFNYSRDEATGYLFFRFVEYSLANNDDEIIDPMIDVILQRKDAGTYTEVFSNTNVTHFVEPFDPGDKWIDTFAEDFKIRHGYHKLIVRLRDGASSEVLAEFVEDFLV